MTQLLDVHPLQTRVGDFVAGLREMAKESFTSAQVSKFMSQAKLAPEALTPYLFWDSARYTRNLIYRDQFFEVLALCWRVGQKTPIHSHKWPTRLGHAGTRRISLPRLSVCAIRFSQSEASAQHGDLSGEPARRSGIASQCAPRCRWSRGRGRPVPNDTPARKSGKIALRQREPARLFETHRLLRRLRWRDSML